jgi:hypothetical protein
MFGGWIFDYLKIREKGRKGEKKGKGKRERKGKKL